MKKICLVLCVWIVLIVICINLPTGFLLSMRDSHKGLFCNPLRY